MAILRSRPKASNDVLNASLCPFTADLANDGGRFEASNSSTRSLPDTLREGCQTNSARPEIKSICDERESMQIRRWKWLLVLLLLLGATLVATGAYFMLSREEEANYRDAVSSDKKLEKCLGGRLALTFSTAFCTSSVQSLCHDNRERDWSTFTEY
jgi:hypothetical protein